MDLSISGLVSLVIWFLVVGAIFYLLWWLIGFWTPPEPFNKILRGIVAVVAVIIIINLLLSLTSAGPFIRLK